MEARTNQPIDGKRLWDSLMGFAEIGATAKGGVRRLTLTDVDCKEEVYDIIVQLDKLYRQEKKNNFKAVAILVAGPDAKPWLEDLGKSRNIEIPLVVLARGPKDVGVKLYNLDPKVRNVFLVTRNRTVDTNISDIRSSDFERVKQAALSMLAKGKT